MVEKTQKMLNILKMVKKPKYGEKEKENLEKVEKM